MPSPIVGMNMQGAVAPNHIGRLPFEEEPAFDAAWVRQPLSASDAPRPVVKVASIALDQKNKAQRPSWASIGKTLLDAPKKTVKGLKAREWDMEIFSFARKNKSRKYQEAAKSPIFERGEWTPDQPPEALSRVSTLPPYPGETTPALSSHPSREELREQAEKIHLETKAALAALAQIPGAATNTDPALTRKIADISEKIAHRHADVETLSQHDHSLLYGWKQGIRSEADRQVVQNGLFKFGRTWPERAQARADMPRWRKYNPVYGFLRTIGKDKSGVAGVDHGLACLRNQGTVKKPLLHRKIRNLVQLCRPEKMREGATARDEKKQKKPGSVIEKFKQLATELKPGDTIELFDGGKVGIENTTTPYVNILGLLPGFSIYPDVRAMRKKDASVRFSVDRDTTSLTFGSREAIDGHIGVTPYVGIQLGALQPGLYMGLSAGAERTASQSVSIHVTGSQEQRQQSVDAVLDCLFKAQQDEKPDALFDRFAQLAVERGNISIGIERDRELTPRVTGHITGTLYEGSSQLTGSESVRLEHEWNPCASQKTHDTGPTYNRTDITRGSGWATHLEVQSALWPPGQSAGSDNATVGLPGLNIFSPRTRLARGGQKTTYSIAQTDQDYLPDQSYRYKDILDVKTYIKFIERNKNVIERNIPKEDIDAYLDKIKRDKNKHHMNFVYQSVMTETGAAALTAIKQLEKENFANATSFAPDWRRIKKEAKNIQKIKEQVLDDERTWEPLKLDAFYNRTDQSSFRGLNYVLAAQSRKGATLQRRLYTTARLQSGASSTE